MIRTKKNLFIAFASLCLSGACTKNFEEINRNPNQVTVGNIQAIGMFEPILYDGANTWLNYTWFWNNELMQFTVFSAGTTREEHRYFISNGNFQTWWNFHARYASNANHMRELAAKENNPTLEAIALTWKVYYLYNQTDMFGDIPYTEAFQAFETGNTKVKFERQEQVYQHMFEDLETANELYKQGYIFRDSQRDKMYGGNVESWCRFNNSLYLRLLMRLSGRNLEYVTQKMNEILNNPEAYPIFRSNEDNATVRFTGEYPYVNYFGNQTHQGFTGSGRRLAEQLIKMTVYVEAGDTVMIDPRLPIYGKINPNAGMWKGAVAGGTIEQTSTSNHEAAFLNTEVFCRNDASYTFMDFAEIQFILAEAALKGIIPGGKSQAKAYYDRGIRASMEKWNGVARYSIVPATITEEAITAFIDYPEVYFNPNEPDEVLQEKLANQKHLALFWIGMEAWHEYRRTGYPVLTIGQGTLNDRVLPTRFAYPSSTIASNSENANEAIRNMGGTNDMKTPVWWSRQAIGN